MIDGVTFMVYTNDLFRQQYQHYYATNQERGGFCIYNPTNPYHYMAGCNYLVEGTLAQGEDQGVVKSLEVARVVQNNEILGSQDHLEVEVHNHHPDCNPGKKVVENNWVHIHRKRLKEAGISQEVHIHRVHRGMKAVDLVAVGSSKDLPAMQQEGNRMMLLPQMKAVEVVALDHYMYVFHVED